MSLVTDSIGVNPSDRVYASDKSIFIWLDILGFAEAVENENKYIELSEQLQKFQQLFNESDHYTTDIISDGIILRINKPTLQLERELRDIFEDIARKQFQFILENKLFIRGGIAIGTRLEKGNSPYISNGLARAVKLEASYVNWAVIGTNGKVISEIKELLNINNEDEDLGLVRGFNKKGKDVFFIDFLKEDEKYLQLLNEKIEEFDSEEKRTIQDKYIWLLRHYFHKFGKSDTTLCINGAVL